MKVYLHRFAQDDLFAAVQWYWALDRPTADRFEQAVEEATKRIGHDPDSLPIENKHYRAIKVHGFPYRLVFEHLEPERVLIVAVAHTSRKPGYWSKRS